jgi:hypothetical protein
MDNSVIRDVVALFAANRISLFYDSGEGSLLITPTLTFDDVIVILTDATTVQVPQAGGRDEDTPSLGRLRNGNAKNQR